MTDLDRLQHATDRASRFHDEAEAAARNACPQSRERLERIARHRWERFVGLSVELGRLKEDARLATFTDSWTHLYCRT